MDDRYINDDLTHQDIDRISRNSFGFETQQCGYGTINVKVEPDFTPLVLLSDTYK